MVSIGSRRRIADTSLALSDIYPRCSVLANSWYDGTDFLQCKSRRESEEGKEEGRNNLTIKRKRKKKGLATPETDRHECYWLYGIN